MTSSSPYNGRWLPQDASSPAGPFDVYLIGNRPAPQSTPSANVRIGSDLLEAEATQSRSSSSPRSWPASIQDLTSENSSSSPFTSGLGPTNHAEDQRDCIDEYGHNTTNREFSTDAAGLLLLRQETRSAEGQCRTPTAASYMRCSPPAIPMCESVAASPAYGYVAMDSLGREKEYDDDDSPLLQYLKRRPQRGARALQGPALKDYTNVQSAKNRMQSRACDAFATTSSKALQIIDPCHTGLGHDQREPLQENANQAQFANAPLRVYPVLGTQPRPLCDNQPQTFRPMQTKLNGSNGFSLLPIPFDPSQSLFGPGNDAYQKMLAGFSPNYRGNINLARNRSADIPADQNCALFILGLPPHVTVTELLGTVRNAGRVYATHVNAPEPTKGHTTCAAKIIFFERRAAERFYDAHAASGLRIPGHPDFCARVVWNRIRTAASAAPRHHSRVLIIAGPAHVANPLALTAYFHSKFEFDVDEVVDRGGAASRRLVEYRFGSFRCQAEAAKIAIGRELADLGVQVWFGRDPCDVPSEPDRAAPLRRF